MKIMPFKTGVKPAVKDHIRESVCVGINVCLCICVCVCARVTCSGLNSDVRMLLMLDHLGHREVKETRGPRGPSGPLHVSAVPSQADLEIHRETRASQEMPL